MRLSDLAVDLGVRQITPQVAEQAVAGCPSGIKAFSAEDPELIVVLARRGINVVNEPVARSKARTWAVAHIGVDDGAGGEAINAPLANRGGAFRPDPLAAFILPDIAERAIAGGIVALSAQHPEISAEVGPSGGTPTRTRNVGGSSKAPRSHNPGLLAHL